MVRTPLWYWIVLDLVVFYNSIGCVTQWHWCVVYLGCGIVYTLWYAILCYYENQFSDEIKKDLSSGGSEKMTRLPCRMHYRYVYTGTDFMRSNRPVREKTKVRKKLFPRLLAPLPAASPGQRTAYAGLSCFFKQPASLG